jgi:hypothetical protein
MDSYSATEPDVDSCIFTVTVMDYCEGYITKPAAFTWAFKIIRTATKEAQTSFEGELYKVIPLRKTVIGMQFKLHFVGVPEHLMNTVIIPAFEREGQVTKFSKDQEQNDKARSASKAADTASRARAIGDLDGVSTLLAKLVALRGEGGPDNARKRRFADNSMSVVARAQKIAAHGMREEKEDVTEAED